MATSPSAMNGAAPSPQSFPVKDPPNRLPSPSPRPFVRPPHLHNVVTSVPLTITPASAHSITSNTTSPANASQQSSPDGPRGRILPQNASPAPLELPEPILTNNSTTTLPMP